MSQIQIAQIDLILVPQGAEYQAVKQALSQIKNNQLPQLLAIPIGSPNFSLSLAKQLESIPNLEKFHHVLVMGLCGSLSLEDAVPTASIGIADPVIYKDCLNVNTQKLLPCNLELTEHIQQKLANTKLVSSLTSDRLIHLASEKQALQKTSAAAVVDMEGYAILEVLTRLNLSTAMVRVISDDASYDLPDLSKAIDQQGNLKSLDLAIAFLRQPLGALRLITGSLKALQALSIVTKNIFLK